VQYKHTKTHGQMVALTCGISESMTVSMNPNPFRLYLQLVGDNGILWTLASRNFRLHAVMHPLHYSSYLPVY